LADFFNLSQSKPVTKYNPSRKKNSSKNKKWQEQKQPLEHPVAISPVGLILIESLDVLTHHFLRRIVWL
jgi:hypothetical protein